MRELRRSNIKWRSVLNTTSTQMKFFHLLSAFFFIGKVTSCSRWLLFNRESQWKQVQLSFTRDTRNILFSQGQGPCPGKKECPGGIHNSQFTKCCTPPALVAVVWKPWRLFPDSFYRHPKQLQVKFFAAKNKPFLSIRHPPNFFSSKEVDPSKDAAKTRTGRAVKRNQRSAQQTRPCVNSGLVAVA